MPRPIAFDLSRLYLGALGSTPRGIDRVDLSVARRLFDDPDRRDIGLVPTPARMGMVSGREARRITDGVEAHWREGAQAGPDERLGPLQAWLAGVSPLPPAPASPRNSRIPWHLAAMLARARRSWLRPAARTVPHGAIYLNTGQVLLGLPWCFGWLEARPDIRPVFMMHDLIPLRFPEYAGPILARHHGRALATAARYGAAMIASSEAAANEIRAGLAKLGRRDMPMHVVSLPVSPSLLMPGEEPPPCRPPYFVTVGILDQRKNHRLLLHVWRDLVRRHGPGVPKLAILGARGLRTAGLHDFLARCPGLSAAVTIVSDLPSAALRDSVRGARALLMPSFTEGFGLPLVEAQALGVPVVASDIPAHREVAGGATTFLDPLDGLGWEREILRLAGDDRRPSVDGRPLQTWSRYFADLLPFLESL